MTMCHDLSCYWAFHCFLTPIFVLLGAHVKSRCLRNLSHPSLFSREVQMVIFFLFKNCHTYTTSNSSCCPQCGITTPPIAPKRAILPSFGMLQSFTSIPVARVNQKLSFGWTSGVHGIIVTEPQVGNYCAGLL